MGSQLQPHNQKLQLFCNETIFLKKEEDDSEKESYEAFDKVGPLVGSVIPVAGLPIPTNCQLTGQILEADDAVRGPLCAHFRVFSKKAYYEHVNRFKRCLVFEYTNNYDKLVSDMAAVYSNIQAGEEKQHIESALDIAREKRNFILGVLEKYASLQFECCPVCYTLAPCEELQPAEDFEALRKKPAFKGDDTPPFLDRLPDGWTLGRATRSFHNGSTPIKHASLPLSCSLVHPSEPLCLEGFLQAIIPAKRAHSHMITMLEKLESACQTLADDDDLALLDKATTNAYTLCCELKNYNYLLSTCPHPECRQPISVESLELGSLDNEANPYGPELKLFQVKVDANPLLVRLHEKSVSRNHLKKRHRSNNNNNNNKSWTSKKNKL